MTPNQSREGSCSGKHSYPNGAAAWAVAERVKVGRARAYRCTYCRKWHIGGSSRRIRGEASMSHPPARRSKTHSARKLLAKAAARAVKAHAKCQTEAEKAAVLDAFVKHLSEISANAQTNR